MDREKREKFQRLVEGRVDNVINALKVLGNCSNKNAYTFDKNDVEEIFEVIYSEVEYIKDKFLEEPKEYRPFRLSNRIELTAEEQAKAEEQAATEQIDVEQADTSEEDAD